MLAFIFPLSPSLSVCLSVSYCELKHPFSGEKGSVTHHMYASRYFFFGCRLTTAFLCYFCKIIKRNPFDGNVIEILRKWSTFCRNFVVDREARRKELISWSCEVQSANWAVVQNKTLSNWEKTSKQIHASPSRMCFCVYIFDLTAPSSGSWAMCVLFVCVCNCEHGNRLKHKEQSDKHNNHYSCLCIVRL